MESAEAETACLEHWKLQKHQQKEAEGRLCMSLARVDRCHLRAGKRRRNNWHGLDYLFFLQ